MPVLAINGGEKIRSTLFPAYSVIGKEEEEEVIKVIRSGVLSKFLGAWHEDFYGGPQVRALEEEWARYFGVKHAIAVNSATSGLFCAVGAAGIGPGDEVIVSPYTMSASATAPLIYNAIPVFADIEEDYFCLNPKSIERKITRRTKAIIVVDLFGQPYDADAINALASKHNLIVIEDTAQAPGAKFKGKYAGTLGDVGVFSLNYHKHIHCGEGGIVVTDNDELADKIRLIRNHAEAVVEKKGFNSLVNMIGFNYRMTEIEAAIARQQLKKLDGLLAKRLENVEFLTKELSRIPVLEPAKIRSGAKHSFYVHPVKYKPLDTGITRNRFVDAVKAELMPTELRESEGVNIGSGYVRPLYLQPLFQQQTAYGDNGCPFKCPNYTGDIDYTKADCPICEDMHFNTLLTHELMRPPISKEDLGDVIIAFKKVWENINELSR